MSTVDPFLTAKEIAEELRCSKAHAHKLIMGTVKGLQPIPHLALGRKYVVQRSSFQAWKQLSETGAILPPHSKSDVVDAVH